MDSMGSGSPLRSFFLLDRTWNFSFTAHIFSGHIFWLVKERWERQPGSRPVASAHFLNALLGSNSRMPSELNFQKKKEKIRVFFFLFKISEEKEGNLKHSLNNRCLLLLTPCQLFSGWAVRKVGYG